MQSSIRVVGASESRMIWILARSTCTPRSSIMYPRYWTWGMPKVHFSIMYPRYWTCWSLCCCCVWITCRMWWRCSSQLWLKMRMPSKYTTTNELVHGCKMSSISVMKVARAFVNLKGITNHSKRPSLDLKVVFHTSEGSISTQWYLDFKSILLKYSPPWIGPEGHQSVGSGTYSGQWSCLVPDSQYRVSKSHPSYVPTQSSSQRVINLAGCDLSAATPKFASWFHRYPKWSTDRLVHWVTTQQGSDRRSAWPNSVEAPLWGRWRFPRTPPQPYPSIVVVWRGLV